VCPFPSALFFRDLNFLFLVEIHINDVSLPSAISHYFLLGDLRFSVDQMLHVFLETSGGDENHREDMEDMVTIRENVFHSIVTWTMMKAVRRRTKNTRSIMTLHSDHSCVIVSSDTGTYLY
jgi:hypothetical protein